MAAFEDIFIKKWGTQDVTNAQDLNSFALTTSDNIFAPMVGSINMLKVPDYSSYFPWSGRLDIGTFGTIGAVDVYANGQIVTDANPMPVKPGALDFAIQYASVDTSKTQIFSTSKKSFSIAFNTPGGTKPTSFRITVWASPEGGTTYKEYLTFTEKDFDTIYGVPQLNFDYVAITCEELTLAGGEDYLRVKVITANL